jgi:hypothetical protein
MRAKEAMLRNFFQNVEAATRDSNVSSRPLRMQPDDTELLKQIQEAQQQVGELNWTGPLPAAALLVQASAHAPCHHAYCLSAGRCCGGTLSMH